MSLMTPEWIEAHNAKVAAFWAEIDPLVAEMTDSQCHEVVKAGLDEGISMNRIAERMREQVGGAWDEGSNVAVGGAMYRAALERLDQYDADFRPRPERLHMFDGDGFQVFYQTAKSEFEVVAGRRTERFRALHRPRFGMDVDDVARAVETGARLKVSDA